MQLNRRLSLFRLKLTQSIKRNNPHGETVKEVSFFYIVVKMSTISDSRSFLFVNDLVGFHPSLNSIEQN